jgi:hypothetical protein
MSDVLSMIGTFLGSSTGKGLLTAGTAGGGLIQNILASREAQKKQQFVENLVTNPAKWNAFVASKEQPLAQGLTADIARSTDAYGAERGLGSSPAVMKDVYAEALAPYVQNEQQMAQNAALQSLGIYEGSPTTKGVDVSSLLKAFMSMPPNRPAFGNLPPTVIGGGQVPVQSAPVPNQIPPVQDPSQSGGSPFDYSSLIDNGALAGGA